MISENLRKKIRKVDSDLNSAYKPIAGKPLLQIASLTFIATLLGLFYIWEYLNMFKVDYFEYFEVKDSFKILYQNAMPIIYVGSLLSLFLWILVPAILKNKNVQPDDQQVEEQTDPKAIKGITNAAVIITVILGLCGFWVLLSAYKFELLQTIILLVFATAACYLYFKGPKNLGVVAAIIIAFLYAEVRARKDAELTMKLKPRKDITLSGQQKPILKKEDTTRYQIFRTSGYYFIKDDLQKMIFVYSRTNGEMNSFYVE
ncbi:MAG: hypothetical protein LBF27_10140 [Sphingobacterium sp.]|jgi:hypothetical protein|nr:hypothetical protein [Sphingobacterium sp.]